MKFLMFCIFCFGVAFFSVRCSTAVTEQKNDLPMFVIEREVPGAGKISQADLKAASQNSCKVLRELGSDIEWSHSYVTGDKLYCVYYASSEELIREHAKKAGIPANLISKVETLISPATAE
jgi:hypothetical protein